MEGGIPRVQLNSGWSMPVVGMGTMADPRPTEEGFRSAMLEAIAAGYRHFDTALAYGSEKGFGEAVEEALRQGLVGSRDELFVTSKLWCTDAHPDLVLPALRRSLQTLQLDYLDLYLIHWPVSLKPKECKIPFDKNDLMPIDLKKVWDAMEECQKMGLVRFIGVSNFSCKQIEQLLSMARIPPSVNQVEMHPLWQQRKMMDLCKEKGIQVCGYSPLGAIGTFWGSDEVMECDVLKDIAITRGKTTAQISLRWIYEQGAGIIVKSYNKGRMKENIGIFGWELSKEELQRISQIPQNKVFKGEGFVSPTGPFKTLDELWDGEI